MKKAISLILAALLLFLLLFSSIANAKNDITFSLNQSEYYFLVGEEAIIPLQVENTYKEQIIGMLAYTITQEINQQGMSYSNTNTQSKPFNVEEGEKGINMGFGSSDQPITLRTSLKFNYVFDNEPMVVSLDDILIHFVSDESQQQNQQSKVESSSKKESQQESSQQEQDALQQQQMQNQQKLQNNQMPQDSSALKQEMQKQLEEQQRIKEEFREELAQNNEFQEAHQELLNKGYSVAGDNIQAETNNTGSFELKYQKESGEEAKIKGELENGELKSLEKQSAEDRQSMLDQLNNDKRFQKFSQQLNEQGFNQTNMTFEQEEEKTSVKMNYQKTGNEIAETATDEIAETATNETGETATITAEFVNNTLTSVELEKEDSKNYLFLVLGLILMALIGYVIYKRLRKKPVPDEEEEKDKTEEKLFDYISESRSMLEEAKELFEKKQYKDAYGRAGQALRLFLSYENGLKKELTNYDVIRFLKSGKKPYTDVKQCFDLCSLVEFAKYDANKKDFERIIALCERIILK